MIVPTNTERTFYMGSATSGAAPTLYDNAGIACYYAFIPLTPGWIYTITITAADTRLRVATYPSEPTGTSSVGIRHVCDSQENPVVGFSFSFTAAQNENILAIYAGAADSGARGIGAVNVEGELLSHDYDSVQAIIDAGTTKMTCLVNNVGYDDNYYTISNPPSWLKYNGVIPTAIYASGNSWFGIGSTTEHIKFNRRDTKMWYLWSEEGTLYNYYRFYKLRWRGYAHYSQSYWLEWELIFFETGDLMIRLVTQPSSYWDGSFNIVASQTYTYTKPTMASPYVSFYSQNQDHSVFQIRYELISIEYPSRWLIEDEGVFYSIEDGELNPLPITELTGDNFEEYGKFDVPDGSLLLPLVQPKLHKWNDGEGGIQPRITTHLTAVPFPQTLDVIVDMSHETITGIMSVTAQFAGELSVCYSLDDGETYTEEESVMDFLNEDFTAIYEGLSESKHLYLRFVFQNDASLTNIRFTFRN